MIGRVSVVAAILAMLLLPGVASALEIEALLDPPTCRVGEQTTLIVTVSSGAQSLPEPKLPDLTTDFDMFPAGTSRNFSLVNGRMSSSVTRRYVLIPRREGTFTVGEITVEDDDGIVKTKPITLVVSASNAPAPPPVAGGGGSQSTTGSDQIFVRASVDNANPFLGQQVTYRVRLYSQLTLLESPGFSPPTTEGFWKEQLPNQEARMETLDGKRYQVLEVAMAVFPTTPGRLTIGEAVLQATVRKAQSRGSQDPFRRLMGRFDGTRMVLRTDPIELDVKPFPPNPPPGFDGVVGDFRLDVSVDATEVAQNDPVTLILKVSGQGNLRTLESIPLPDLPGFRVYPSQPNRIEEMRGLSFGGTVTQQYVLVPLTAGRQVIPAVRVPVFSPRTGRYRDLSTEPITLLVSAAAASGEPGNSGPARGDIEVVGRDIRFIETAMPAFVETSTVGRRVLRWLVLLPLPVLAYAGLWGWERRRRRFGSDVALSRRSRAAREARRILRTAGQSPAEERAGLAAEAVRGYVADRFNLPSAGITREQVAGTVSGLGLDESALLAFLDGCDAARFAPSGGESGDGDWIAEAGTWIDRLEAVR